MRNSQYANATRSAEADALAPLCNGGKLRIYSGAQPANAETAVPGGAVLLAELTLANPAFGAAANGVLTANAIATVAALATGVAAWFRIVKADGVTVVMDGSIDTGDANLIMNSKNIQQNADVKVSSLTVTVAAAGT